MRAITGYEKAKLTAHWIKTKPTQKDNKLIPLDSYIKAVCKKKKWEYK